MKRGNVLVIGNSGVGKSTLINAVLGENRARTGHGYEGTTDKLEIYESMTLPFRLIDTIGFEPTFIKEQQAIGAVKKWSKECAKEGKDDNQINVIWFCVDGTAKKLFPKAIKSLTRATSIWKSVPVIVVITKSYSIPERDENIEMVKAAFRVNEKHVRNVRKIIPVVAATYSLNDTAYAPPEGITELIEVTNQLMPEGIQAGAHDLAAYKVERKKAMAHGIVAAATASGVVVGAVPVPIDDALILSPIEIAEVNGLARLYGIKKSEQSKQFLNTIVEIGTVSMVAKNTLNKLKAIPGLNVSASVLNAVVAGCFVAALGEGSIYIFEKIYLGEKSIADIDWVKKVLEAKLSAEILENVKEILKDVNQNKDPKELAKDIVELFRTATK